MRCTGLRECEISQQQDHEQLRLQQATNLSGDMCSLSTDRLASKHKAGAPHEVLLRTA